MKQLNFFSVKNAFFQAKFVSFLPPHKIQSRNETLYIKKLENLER